MKVNGYLRNSVWLIADKFFVLLGGLIATTFVAKYLGPEKFGVLSYGITLSMFITAISQWGSSFLVFNIAAKDVAKAGNIIISTIWYRFYLYIFCTVLVSIYLFFNLEFSTAKFISVICISNVFLGLDIYQYYFNGSLRSEFNTRVTFISKVVSIIIKILLIIFNTSLYLFFIPILIEGVIIFLLKHKTFIKSRCNYDSENTIDLKRLLSEGFPYVASSFLVLAYTKANDLVLRELTSFVEVGLFSAGLLLSNAWTFIPLAIGTSLLTKAIKSKREEDFAFTYVVSILFSCPILIFIFLFPEYIIQLTFGGKYSHLTNFLPLLSIGSLFGVIVFLVNRHISNFEKGGLYLIKKTLVTAVLSVVVSIVLVKEYGIEGAVYSWIIVQFFGMSLANIFYNKIRWSKVIICILSARVMLKRLKELT